MRKNSIFICICAKKAVILQSEMCLCARRLAQGWDKRGRQTAAL